MKKEDILEQNLIKYENSFSTFTTKTITLIPNKRKLIKQLKVFTISLLLFIVSYILYYLSLKGCKKTEYECLTEERVKFFYKLGIATFFSSLFFSILIKFLIKYKQWLLIIIYSFIFLIQVFSNGGEDMEHHGRFNMLGFFFFIFFDLIIIKIFEYFYKLINRKKYKKFAIIISIILILIISYLIIHRTVCNNFYDGLGGFKVINNETEDACYLGKPKTCDIPIFSKISLFDYSRFIYSCKNRRNDKKKFIKFLNAVNPNLNVTGNTYYFPNTNIFSFKESNWNVMYNNVFKNITGNKISGTHDQFWITFDKNDKGHINIDIPYNETLVKEKRKIAENHKVKFENVYTIYIDHISRQHFQRKLKKTSKLLDYMLRNRNAKFYNEEYSKYNIDDNIDAYQFFKYHCLGYNTPPNYGAMFFGITPFSLNQSKSIMEQFSNKGFITATAVNSCAREAYNLVPNFYHVNFYPSDYEGSAIFCDPHFFIPEDRYSVYAGINSKVRRCFYERDTGEYIFEYILKFLETYKNERKFLRLISNDAHEGTGELIKYIDNALHDFLLTIFTKYFDDKTIIIFLSDHGASLVGAYELMLSEDKQFEKMLGFLYMFLPKNSSYNSFVEYNEQRMVTPYDIFGTFIDILYEKEERPDFYFNGQSLLEKINGLERTCKKYNELKNYHFCRCFDY